MALIEYKIVSIIETPKATIVTLRFYAGSMRDVNKDRYDETGHHIDVVNRFVRASRIVTRTRVLPPGTTRVQIENHLKALAADYPQHQLVSWQA